MQDGAISQFRQSGMAHAIVCPNGFFNDMSEILKMANTGTVYLIGDGSKKINPIHGDDLAKLCVNAVTASARTPGRRAAHLHLPGDRRDSHFGV